MVESRMFGELWGFDTRGGRGEYHTTFKKEIGECLKNAWITFQDECLVPNQSSLSALEHNHHLYIIYSESSNLSQS